MSLFGRSSSNFDKYLEQATSNLLLEPDWTAILNICDCIRQGDVQAKYAVSAIKKKLFAQNPHVALYALQVLESCIKNCGSPVHQEIVSRQFMEELRELIKVTPHDTVKNKILELIQTWAHAFRTEPNYRAVQDTVNLMKMEGFKFPVLRESDAMFAADIAPDWAEGECCHRCRIQFSVVNRRHHCRNCGQIFCQKCSARNSAIPKFGIEKEVRVCEACWEKLNRAAQKAAPGGAGSEQSSPFASQSSPSLTPGTGGAPSSAVTAASGGGTGSGGKTEQELQEEEDLQLALALSQSEAENKEKAKSSFKSGMKTSPANNPAVTSASDSSELRKVDLGSSNSSNNGAGSGGADTELARYLNRSYWEQKQEENANPQPQQQSRSSPVPSAPSTNSSSPSSNINNNALYSVPKGLEHKNVSNGGELDDMNEFMGNLKSTLEIFVNRMQSNYSRGRPIANDTYVQSLFLSITNMHSQLIMHIQKQDDKRVHFEGLQDKLAQIRDARAALDALREEHRERLRQEAEEAERQRQIQMAQKLDIMRKKKQEYLQYQRQIAMQRMQEQEREMQLRQEQQKYHMGMVAGGPPGGGHPQPGSVPYQPQQQGVPSYLVGGPPQASPHYPMGAPGAAVVRGAPNSQQQGPLQGPPLQQHGHMSMGVVSPSQQQHQRGNLPPQQQQYHPGQGQGQQPFQLGPAPLGPGPGLAPSAQQGVMGMPNFQGYMQGMGPLPQQQHPQPNQGPEVGQRPQLHPNMMSPPSGMPPMGPGGPGGPGNHQMGPPQPQGELNMPQQPQQQQVPLAEAALISFD